MTNLVHVTETALLFLAAYLLGCVVGYAARRVLFAARGTRQPNVIMPAAVPESVASAPPVTRRRTPAARLAAAASGEPMPSPVDPPVQPAPARSAPASAPTPEPAVKPTPTPRPKRKPVDPKPAALSAPRDGRADNLKQIKGIGPKIEASLNAMGIYHLDQIAAWTKSNIDWVDAQLAFKGRIRREQWVEQAIKLTKASVGA